MCSETDCQHGKRFRILFAITPAFHTETPHYRHSTGSPILGHWSFTQIQAALQLLKRHDGTCHDESPDNLNMLILYNHMDVVVMCCD